MTWVFFGRFFNCLWTLGSNDVSNLLVLVKMLVIEKTEESLCFEK